MINVIATETNVVWEIEKGAHYIQTDSEFYNGETVVNIKGLGWVPAVFFKELK